MKTRHKKLGAWAAIGSFGIAPFFVSMNAFSASILEEVVVEAQKKSESIIETPIAINAITGEQFQKQASFNFQDIVRSTPGLSIEPGALPDIHLRGTSTVTRSATAQRTNVYQDGALQDNPRSVFDAQFDIERFEVLRGPQGTLYGKSSPTGTINVQTKSPNMSEIDGYVSGTAATRDMQNINFGVSLPIIEDVLAVRLSGVYDNNRASGVKNDATGSEALSRSSAGRIVVAFHPTDSFSARLSHQYREHKENAYYVNSGGGYSVSDLKANVDYNDSNRFRDKLTILEMTQEFTDHLSLTSITSYQDQTFPNDVDIDGTPLAAETQFTNIHIEPNFQEDIRLASSDNDFWDWQLGYFYERSGSKTAVNGFTNLTDPTEVHVAYLTDANISREEHALYTHNTFKLTDDLNMIVGLRYQTGRSVVDQPFSQSIVVPAYNLNMNSDAHFFNKLTSYATTGTVKLQYYFTPDLIGYATVDRAFRAGVGQLDLKGNLPPDLALIPDETANSAEIGLKGNFADQRGRFAVAVYDQVFKDYSQDVYSVPIWDISKSPAGPGALSSAVAAAKKAETRGVEAEVNFLILDNWDAGLAVSFVDAKYKDFDNAPCDLGTASLSPTNLYNTCDLSGERMPQNARWSGVFTSNYSLPVTDGMDWYFNTMVNFKDSQVDELTRRTLGGYATADFFTGLRAGGNGPWDVSLWVKNAFDRRVVTRVFQSEGSTDSGGITLPYDRVFTNTPRQVGVTGTYKF